MWNSSVLFFFYLFVIEYLVITRAIISNDCWKLKASANVSEYQLCSLLDKKTHPCQDFYRYSCGVHMDFKNNSKVLRNERHSVENDVKNSNMDYVKGLLQSDSKYFLNYKTLSEYNPAVDLYKSCMNKSKIGLQPMIELLKKHGGWSTLRSDYWDQTNWAGLNRTKEILNLGLDMAPILTMEFTKEHNTFSLGPPTFAIDMDRIYTHRADYHRLMIDVAFGAFKAVKLIADMDMRDVIYFEIKLVELYRTNKTVKEMTIGEMKLKFPELMKFTQPFIEPYLKSDSNITIRLKHYNYFVGLESVLSRTADRTVANYIIIRAVFAASEYSTTHLDQLVSKVINQKEYGVPYGDHKCVDQVNNLLPMAIDSLYIQQKLDSIKGMEGLVNEIATNVKKQLIKMVNNSLWINEETKKIITEKLTSITIFIAHPPYIDLEMKSLADYGLKINTSNFFQNALNIRKYRDAHPIRKSNLSAWDVLVEYIEDDNIIYIPLGALQNPLFYLDAAPAFNYGGIGHRIGHAIGQLIDKMLRTSNSDSDWSKSTVNEYELKAKCFERQFSEMKIKDKIKIYPDGVKTNSEDISDYLGVLAAYRAYRKLQTQEDPLLNCSWNCTTRQVFWISMAQSLCSFIPKYGYRKIIEAEVQTISEFRVLGIIKNFLDFPMDFACPYYSNMFTKQMHMCEVL